MCLYDFAFLLQCCNFGYDFCIKRYQVRLYHQIFVICITPYLRDLYLFTCRPDNVSTKKGGEGRGFQKQKLHTICEHLGWSPCCLFPFFLIVFGFFLGGFFFLFLFVYFLFLFFYFMCVVFWGGSVHFTLLALSSLFFDCVLCLVSSFACVNSPFNPIGFIYLLFIMH